jgi:hypothetical protein
MMAAIVCYIFIVLWVIAVLINAYTMINYTTITFPNGSRIRFKNNSNNIYCGIDPATCEDRTITFMVDGMDKKKYLLKEE